MKHPESDPNESMGHRNLEPLTWSCVMVGVVVGAFLLFFVFILTRGCGPVEDLEPAPIPTSATPPLPAPPAPIIDFGATVVDNNAVTFHWNPVSGANMYDIGYEGYEDPPGDGFVWGYEETRNTDYTVTGLLAGVEYTFKIRAFGDGSRYSGWSRAAQITVQIPPDTGNSDDSGAESDE